MKRVVKAVIIDANRGLLLVQDKTGIWALPTAEIKNGDSKRLSLENRLSELLGSNMSSVDGHYNDFTENSSSLHSKIKSFVYFAELKDSFTKNIKDMNIRFINNFLDYRLSKATSKIIISLKKDYYL